MSFSSSASQDKFDPELKIGFQASGAMQSLDDKINNNSFHDIPRGFQNATGNITFDLNMFEGIDVYFDLYLSSAHHVGAVTDHEGYIYISKLPHDYNIGNLNKLLKYIDIKAGHFELDFGNQHLFRSDNADVQRNLLIGNYIMDPNTVAPAFELRTSFDAPLNMVVGLSSGTPTGDFKKGRGTALYGKTRFASEDSYDIAFSIYNVDHSKNQTGYPNNGSYSSLFSGNRSGGKYAAVWGGGPEPGQIMPGKGQDELAWQLDAKYTFDKISVYGLYGNVRDDDSNGSDEGVIKDEWSYLGLESKIDFTERFYGAFRYNAAIAKMYKGVESDGIVSRYQIGVGMWIVPGMLFKVEYVNQHAKNFKQSFLQHDPEFSGVISEISVDFSF